MKGSFLKENERIFYEPSDEPLDLPKRVLAVGNEAKSKNVKKGTILTMLNDFLKIKSTTNKINMSSGNNLGAIVYENADIYIDIEGFIEKLVTESENGTISSPFRKEVKTILSYMDQLLESLPENKIEEFAKSDNYDIYKKLFKDLGLYP